MMAVFVGATAVWLAAVAGLIRKSTRRMMLEEAFDALPSEPRVPNSSSSAN
jgi:hypothetical protein